MALIIKGDMPVSCFGCEMDEFWTTCPLHNMAEVEFESWKDTEGVHPDCPIIGEIPDKHGALVDKTELTRKMVHLVNDKGEHFFALKVEDYNNLPVILEAST